MRTKVLGALSMGSSVPFLVDYDNPRWHRMEDLGGGQTSP
jgi:hypothetical protein